MASVYILYSNELSKFYVGSCLNLSERLEQHKLKTFDLSFTAKVNDWVLFFETSNLNYNQARDIEQHIKKMKSSTYIRNLAKHPDIMKKLILKFT